MDADEIVQRLQLAPHPEGGMYAETWRAPAADGERPSGTAIHFLLRAGDRSHWHRVDATEIWHFYAGDPLELQVSPDGRRVDTSVLGADLARGERPQLIVPPHAWQAARTTGTWTLVGCTVSPGFDFAGFELAPQTWAPSQS
jgi:predicted cupin superfamily sugar epimerase